MPSFLDTLFPGGLTVTVDHNSRKKNSTFYFSKARCLFYLETYGMQENIVNAKERDRGGPIADRDCVEEMQRDK